MTCILKAMHYCQQILRKYRDKKLVTTERRRDCLVSEPNFDTTKFFTKTLLAIEMKKRKIKKKRKYL